MSETTPKTVAGMPASGFVDGSNLVMKIAGKGYGHAVEHKLSYSSETKERLCKPAFSAGYAPALFSNKAVVGLGISISASGLKFYGEEDTGYGAMAAEWYKGQSVQVDAYMRGADKPYLSGMFVITKLDSDAKVKEDATWSVELENDGAPSAFDPTIMNV